MMSLAYMLDNPSDLTIVGEKGSLGQLKVNLIPVDEVLVFIKERPVPWWYSWGSRGSSWGSTHSGG